MVMGGAGAATVVGVAAPLAALSAMVTPAVLILASGSLVLTTSQRLGRVIDRTRAVSQRFGDLATAPADRPLLTEERELLFEQLERATVRVRYLQRAMASIYIALAIFAMTSVGLGLATVFETAWAWAPLVLGGFGVALLFFACLNLAIETRIAIGAVRDEMEFVKRLRRHHTPPELFAEWEERHRVRWSPRMR